MSKKLTEREKNITAPVEINIYINMQKIALIAVFNCLLLCGAKNLQAAPFQVDVLKKVGKTVFVYYDLHGLGSGEESSQMFCGLCHRLSVLNQRSEHVRLLVECPKYDQTLRLPVTSFDHLIASIRSNEKKIFLRAFDWLQSNRDILNPNIELIDIDLPCRSLFVKVYKYISRLRAAGNLYCEFGNFLRKNSGGDVNEILCHKPVNLSDEEVFMILDWVKNGQPFHSARLFNDDEMHLIERLSFSSVVNWALMDDLQKSLNAVFPMNFVKEFLNYLVDTDSMDFDVNKFVPAALENCNAEYFRSEFFVRFCLDSALLAVCCIKKCQGIVAIYLEEMNKVLEGISITPLQNIVGVFDIAKMLHDVLYIKDGRNFDVHNKIFDFFKGPHPSMSNAMIYLVDLNIMIKILSSNSTKDIVFVGGVHANEIVNALKKLEFEEIDGIPASNLAGIKYADFEAACSDNENIRMLSETCFDLIL